MDNTLARIRCNRNFGFVAIFYMLILCGTRDASADVRVPILLYHRFGPAVTDSMTMTTPGFESQLKHIRDGGYTVIPLQQLVDYRLGRGPAPPPRAVVITADDGHRSLYTDMWSLLRRYHLPATLFIYPSAISNAPWALTWGQLREMQDSGLIDVQSHTYWHPNFKQEKRRLAAHAYDRLVTMQLAKPREVLHEKLGVTADMLAWPFGIHDPDLMQRARAAGYVAAFTLVRRPANDSDDLLALPRYLMTDADRDKVFARLLAAGSPNRTVTARVKAATTR